MHNNADEGHKAEMMYVENVLRVRWYVIMSEVVLWYERSKPVQTAK